MKLNRLHEDFYSYEYVELSIEDIEQQRIYLKQLEKYIKSLEPKIDKTFLLIERNKIKKRLKNYSLNLAPACNCVGKDKILICSNCNNYLFYKK
jgi:hypothetical protein